ncbi:DNA-directed RNA polymerase II core subunit rpb9, partial [Apophysomyces sp. BC1034]
MLSDLATDPTLPRASVACTACGYPEAVFFQSSSRRADAKMTLFYVCANRSC